MEIQISPFLSFSRLMKSREKKVGVMSSASSSNGLFIKIYRTCIGKRNIQLDEGAINQIFCSAFYREEKIQSELRFGLALFEKMMPAWSYI